MREALTWYSAALALVALPIVALVWERASFQSTAWTWRRAAVAAVLAHPLSAVIVIALIRKVLRQNGSCAADLSWSTSAARWILVAQSLLVLASIRQQYLSLRFLRRGVSRVVMWISLVIAPIELSFFVFVSYLEAPKLVAAAVSGDHALRVVSVHEFGACSERIEWPAMFPVVGEEIHRFDDWLECPDHLEIRFVTPKRVEFRRTRTDRVPSPGRNSWSAGTPYLTYNTGEHGCLPGGGGTLEERSAL